MRNIYILAIFKYIDLIDLKVSLSASVFNQANKAMQIPLRKPSSELTTNQLKLTQREKAAGEKQKQNMQETRFFKTLE